MEKLSVVIITLNEEPVIERCIRSVAGIADEILVVDSGSTDRTVEIAQKLGACVRMHDWPGYAEQKSWAAGQVANRWILSLDADEEISPALALEIRLLSERDFNGKSGFDIPFVNMFLGRQLRFGHSQGERHMRLFDRTRSRMSGGAVHESFRVDGPKGSLRNAVLHFSYRNLADYFDKFNRYTTLAARAYASRKKKASPAVIVIRLPLTFFSVYLFKLGFLDGWPGFVAAVLHSCYTFVKYAKLLEFSGTKDTTA